MFSSVSWGFQGAQELINLHPLFVHFPIALLLASAASYFLGTVFRKEELFTAGKWTLYLGTVAAALTVWTGLQAASTVSHGAGVHELMIIHQYFGYVILGLSVILSLWLLISKAHMPGKGRFLFLILLFVLTGLVAQSADFGGRMVFQHGVGMGKKSMMHIFGEERQVLPEHFWRRTSSSSQKVLAQRRAAKCSRKKRAVQETMAHDHSKHDHGEHAH
jgi:uncharacterized membrane protein